MYFLPIKIFREECFLINENIESQLLLYSLQFIGYALDVVCYACVDIFNNLLKLHENRCINCTSNKLECKWIYDINQLLTDLKSLSAFRLRALVFIFVLFKKF